MSSQMPIDIFNAKVLKKQEVPLHELPTHIRLARIGVVAKTVEIGRASCRERV